MFEGALSITELASAAFPDSFVASADGVLEDSDVVSDLPVSPAGCSVGLVSPDVTGNEVESPVGVSDGVPDSSE